CAMRLLYGFLLTSCREKALTRELLAHSLLAYPGVPDPSWGQDEEVRNEGIARNDDDVCWCCRMRGDEGRIGPRTSERPQCICCEQQRSFQRCVEGRLVEVRLYRGAQEQKVVAAVQGTGWRE